jgi:hypothetical protein
LHNKFLAPWPGIELNCVFKVFPFILVISIYDNLKKKKKIFSFNLIFFFKKFCVPFVILLMWGDIPASHGQCSYCFNPYHHVRDCPEIRQFSNYHYKNINTPFSRPGNDFYSDSYNPAWSQQSNFSR